MVLVVDIESKIAPRLISRLYFIVPILELTFSFIVLLVFRGVPLEGFDCMPIGPTPAAVPCLPLRLAVRIKINYNHFRSQTHNNALVPAMKVSNKLAIIPLVPQYSLHTSLSCVMRESVKPLALSMMIT